MSDETRQLLEEGTILAGGGTETYLLFQQGFPLREFCAFEVFEDEAALEKLKTEYLFPMLSALAGCGHGFLLDSLVWRAHPDYVTALGYAADEVGRINRGAVARTRAMVEEWRAENDATGESLPIFVSADVGPRGDGYQRVAQDLTVEAATDYHSVQMQALAAAGVDVVAAVTITSATEAIGIARAAKPLAVPIFLSPTVETDGSLPDGSPLRDFVARVDDETDGLATGFFVNCAHPSHLRPTLEAARQHGETWLDRLVGMRANASRLCHAELDECTELDRGNPDELASELAALRREFGLRILGGCCGTDGEHVAAIARAIASD